MKSALDIIKRSLLPLMMVFLAVTCKKTFDTKDKLPLSVSQMAHTLAETDSPTCYNYVWLFGDQTANGADSGFHITVGAAFTDSTTGQLIAINALQVNSRVLNPNTDHTYNFSYSDSSGTLSEGLALFGTNVKVKITGTSSADTVTRTVYMPKKVYKNLSDFPTGSFNNTGNLTINWTTDPSNTTGDIMIKLWYNAAINRFQSDSTLPATDKELSYLVADNGSYSISASDLQAFQQKSLIHISLGRGIQYTAVLPVSHKQVFYFTTASESGTELYMGCVPKWVNTGASPQCLLYNGLNTGYIEQQQQDTAVCSPTHNQTRWTVTGQNLTACPLPVTVQGSDTRTVGYNVRFTNSGTGTLYTFVINANTNILTQLGQVPVGTYSVLIWPTGAPQNATFNVNGNIQTGTGANYSGLTINSASTVMIY